MSDSWTTDLPTITWYPKPGSKDDKFGQPPKGGTNINLYIITFLCVLFVLITIAVIIFAERKRRQARDVVGMMIRHANDYDAAMREKKPVMRGVECLDKRVMMGREGVGWKDVHPLAVQAILPLHTKDIDQLPSNSRSLFSFNPSTHHNANTNVNASNSININSNADANTNQPSPNTQSPIQPNNAYRFNWRHIWSIDPIGTDPYGNPGRLRSTRSHPPSTLYPYSLSPHSYPTHNQNQNISNQTQNISTQIHNQNQNQTLNSNLGLTPTPSNLIPHIVTEPNPAQVDKKTRDQCIRRAEAFQVTIIIAMPCPRLSGSGGSRRDSRESSSSSEGSSDSAGGPVMRWGESASYDDQPRPIPPFTLGVARVER